MPFRDSTTWMWAEACQLLEQAERLQRQFFRVGASEKAGPRWEPPVDVFESDEEIVIVVALPGVAADRLEAQIDSSCLVIRAVRSIPFERRGYLIRRVEIPYGYFERRIDLPDVPVQLVAQELVNGCLFLSLRKMVHGGMR